MGIFREAIEDVKASLWEATVNNSMGGLGPILKIITHTEALFNDWEEVTLPRGFLGTSKYRHVGQIKANRPDIKIKGLSDNGFYVEKGQKAAAVAYLNSVNLKAE